MSEAVSQVDFTGVVLPMLVGLSGNIRENAGNLVEAGLAILEGIGTAMTDGSSTLLLPIQTIFTNMLGVITDNAPLIFEAVLGLIQNLGANIGASLPGFIQNTALPFLLKFSETIRSGAGQLVDTGINLILNLAQGIMDSLPALIEQLPQIVINIAGVINDNAPKLLLAGLQLIIMLGKGIIAAIPTFVENIPEIFKAFVAVWSALNWLDLGKNVIGAIKKGFNALRNNLPNTLKSIGQSAKDFFTGIDWATAGKDIIGFIESAIRGLFETIPGVLLEIGNAAWEAFKEIDWFDLGSKAIDGIASGLKAGIGWIKEKAKEVASNAVQAAKDRLEVKSPSRVMRREVGLMYGRGLALGIEDSERDVERAIERLNKDMLTGINRDVDYSPRFDFVSKGSKSGGDGRIVNVTINSNVDGATNAEQYAYRLIQALQQELRTEYGTA